MVLKMLFGDIPREFGRKRVFVDSFEDFIQKINRYNGLIDCYATIYTLQKPRNYNSAIVDKVYLDLDRGEDAFKAIQKAHGILKMYDIMHTILFTGGGYNIYVYVEPAMLLNPKDAIKRVQNYIASTCGLMIGKPDEADIDEHVIGDVARIARIPFTKNIKYSPGRFCFPLTENHIYDSHEHNVYISQDSNLIQDIKSLPDERFIYGNRKINIKEYDSEQFGSEEMFEDIDITELEKWYKNDEYSKFVKPLFPFIQELLYTTKCGWQDRYLSILCMKELGYPMELTTLVCKHYWTPQKFRHCVAEEYQIQYIYSRSDLFFPRPETIRNVLKYKLSSKDIKMINELYR